MVKRTAEGWLKLPEYSHITILDPDGWDRKNFEESWNEFITEEEFQKRLSYSTTIEAARYGSLLKTTAHTKTRRIEEV